MRTIETKAYTIKELKELDYSAYEKALDQLRQHLDFEYIDPWTCGYGQEFIDGLEVPLVIPKISIDSLSELYIAVDWSMSKWDFKTKELDERYPTLARLNRWCGHDYHEYLDISRGYNRYAVLSVDLNYRWAHLKHKRISKELNMLINDVDNWLRTVEGAIVSQYVSEVESFYSDDSMEELACINLYEFDEKGAWL